MCRADFFSQTDTEIIIPANVNNVLYNAITIGHTKLLKFEESDKPIKLFNSAIFIEDILDCIEFNRPCTIRVYDIELYSNDNKIKEFNIFSNIEFKVSHGETVFKHINKDVEINIKDGVNVKIGMFSSDSGKEIKKFLSSLFVFKENCKIFENDYGWSDIKKLIKDGELKREFNIELMGVGKYGV